MAKKIEVNKSFVMNMFRGAAVTEQAIPYPYTLSEEQRETLEMLVDPTEKFFEVRGPGEGKGFEWFGVLFDLTFTLKQICLLMT